MTANSPTKAGWRPIEWAADAGISRAYCYRLLEAGTLRSVKIGAARVIITSPSEYLARLAAEQAAVEEAAD